MTLSELLRFDGFLEKVIQLGWLGISTNPLPSLLEQLEIDHINDHGSS